MIEDAISTVDREERLAKYAELQRYIMDLCPSIFLYDYLATVAFQDYVDWPAMKDPSNVIPVMGYNYDGRTWQVSTISQTTRSYRTTPFFISS